MLLYLDSFYFADSNCRSYFYSYGWTYFQSYRLYGGKCRSLRFSNRKMSILAPVRGFNINFNYDPQRAYTDQQGVRHDEPNFTYIPSATKLTGPIANMLILFPLGMYLYTRSPNEQNGNFLLYPKLKTLCMICCVIFIGMFGGMAAGGSRSILNYYIGFIGTSMIVYLLLSRLLKFKFSWRVK